MIDMHSKYDNKHKNKMFYAVICVNNHIIACVKYMLSLFRCKNAYNLMRDYGFVSLTQPMWHNKEHLIFLIYSMLLIFT